MEEEIYLFMRWRRRQGWGGGRSYCGIQGSFMRIQNVRENRWWFLGVGVGVKMGKVEVEIYFGFFVIQFGVKGFFLIKE